MATTNFTSLLGLALPTTGDLAGTWGTEVNNAITSLLDTAVAGTTTLNTDIDVTLSTTNGAANQARSAVLLWTATGSTTRNITAPAQSKAYVVINATGGTQSIVVRGAGPTTGVTVIAGEKAIIAWGGSDFVKVSSSVATSLTGVLPIANGGTNTTTTPTAGAVPYGTGTAYAFTSAGTANQILQSNGASPPTWINPVPPSNNSFTGANTFYNNTGQTFGTGTSTQDGIIIAGRAGGSSSYRVTLKPGGLSASRSATLPDTDMTIGYINLPAVGTKTSGYTLVANDVGKYVQLGASGSVTIPASVFAEGDAITIYNNTSSGATITCSAVTAYAAGTDSIRTSVTIIARGVATVLFYSANNCVISGNVT